MIKKIRVNSVGILISFPKKVDEVIKFIVPNYLKDFIIERNIAKHVNIKTERNSSEDSINIGINLPGSCKKYFDDVLNKIRFVLDEFDDDLKLDVSFSNNAVQRKRGRPKKEEDLNPAKSPLIAIVSVANSYVAYQLNETGFQSKICDYFNDKVDNGYIMIKIYLDNNIPVNAVSIKLCHPYINYIDLRKDFAEMISKGNSYTYNISYNSNLLNYKLWYEQLAKEMSIRTSNDNTSYDVKDSFTKQADEIIDKIFDDSNNATKESSEKPIQEENPIVESKVNYVPIEDINCHKHAYELMLKRLNLYEDNAIKVLPDDRDNIILVGDDLEKFIESNHKFDVPKEMLLSFITGNDDVIPEDKIVLFKPSAVRSLIKKFIQDLDDLKN